MNVLRGPCCGEYQFSEEVTPYDIALYYRSAKKICRKCYARLPLDSDKCRNKKCHNTDLRVKGCLRTSVCYQGYNPKRVINIKEIRKKNMK